MWEEKQDKRRKGKRGRTVIVSRQEYERDDVIGVSPDRAEDDGQRGCGEQEDVEDEPDEGEDAQHPFARALSRGEEVNGRDQSQAGV